MQSLKLPSVLFGKEFLLHKCFINKDARKQFINFYEAEILFNSTLGSFKDCIFIITVYYCTSIVLYLVICT